MPSHLYEVYNRIRLFLFSLSFLSIGEESAAQASRPDSVKRTDVVQPLNPQDTALVMPADEFYRQILAHHPVARQAALLTESARQEIRIARGSFDPKVEAVYNRKEFGSKEYYNQWDSYLKIPLWIGELKGGYETNRGAYLNPENYLSGNRMGYVGISVPIGQNMVIDARRATLRQAQLFGEIAEADRVQEINKLLLNAAKDYWNWYQTYNDYQLLQNAYQFADVRYQATQERVINGDLAPIDSVEAGALLQDWQIKLQQAEVQLINTRLLVSNYLWGEDNIPREILASVVPDTTLVDQPLDEDTLQQLVQFAQAQHPELRKLDGKLGQLAVEERFARDRFKPLVQVDYNVLSQTPVAPEIIDGTYLGNNYKLGVQVAFPLFLRKERGKLQSVQIKQDQASLERSQTNREITNQVYATYNSIKNLEQVIQAQRSVTDSYQQLRDGEVEKFSSGESSIFLINARETKLIEARQKLVSLQAKYEQEKAILYWAAGASADSMLVE